MGMIDVTVTNVGTNGREWCPILGSENGWGTSSGFK